ncbi:EamA family transporter RarD [Nitratireductor aquimarinus]|uniref:EamA family transporter RarD n=1 Tax=Nitratireductor aquimarinus TaxID=889300 RepID=A0ABU4AJN6_9HYPH|nr:MULTISPECIES: EamA family transporter RarD [Alphaproteobacteria]MBY6020827.1 EamA family transporter RarD [Nitratireductor sp. DP7N14-4]MBN7756041.1 EamA family transporter RarD [Nitratireductor aquimarinus]MBN7763907.1 EamA family transporter RarD [Nitratireductor aquibiodomus]MBY5998799.1 EamA family transporter RarD [Tritonibacter mobilis]MCV0348693.1 EamA family transporter RarD [Nitratireductor sp.]
MSEIAGKPLDESRNDALRGFVFAMSAYAMWGFLPLYMKLVAHIPATEVVAHRVLWSLPVAAVILLVLGRTSDVREALRSPRTLMMAALTAAIISCNWGIYVWAIATDRAVETALGYYINPLVSIAMAAIFLGERLNRLQIAAVCLAAVAVVVLTTDAGGLPWVSLSLALSFAAYGILRKTLPIGPSQGFFLEVLILTLPAIGYLGWLAFSGEAHFGPASPTDMLLLIGCGPVTAIPLILFASGAKLLRYSTIGIMQYTAPTMIFLIAVFVFKEPFGGVKAIAFALIWAALALYSWSMLREARQAKK